MDDSIIIDLFWKRSETAVSQTELKYGSTCNSIAFNIVGNHEDADECVNDTYMNVWNSIPPQRPNSLFAYLAKITRNVAINKYRQRRALKRTPNGLEMIFDELEECIPAPNSVQAECELHDLTEQINAFLKTLTDESQVVFVRRYWYSDSVQSISLRYGISESKVKSMLFRSREKLKKYLMKEGIAI